MKILKLNKIIGDTFSNWKILDETSLLLRWMKNCKTELLVNPQTIQYLITQIEMKLPSCCYS